MEIIKIKNYKHAIAYNLPVRPSPNLPNQQSINLYPSLCLFEGTKISVGRGTDFPFQVAGAPDSTYGNFNFLPHSNPGNKEPIYKDKICFGIDLRNEKISGLTLKFLIEFYEKCPDKNTFFNKYFDTLAGTASLKEDIIKGKKEEEIKSGWEAGLAQYKLIRKKYLLYED